MVRISLLALLILAACAEFPEVDTAVEGFGEGPAPILLPTDDLLARANQPPRASEDTASGVEARVARLRARAAQVRARPAS